MMIRNYLHINYLLGLGQQEILSEWYTELCGLEFGPGKGREEAQLREKLHGWLHGPKNRNT